MSRTTPVHSGYTILNGAGSGSNGNRIDVWVEYKLGTQSVSGNYTPITAYFYAALNPGYSSTTSYYSGLNSSFSVNGAAGSGVSNGAYDFTSSAKVNLLGSYAGNIPHNQDGTKSVTITGSFTTASSYITGGSVTGSVTLPAIARAAELSCQDTTLGGSCVARWTPASKDHTFALTFSLGDWSDTLSNIAPGSTAGYACSKALSMDLARQFAGKSAKMTVTLTTYQSGAALGRSSQSVTVTVPDTEETRPRVEAILTPASTPFAGLYVQGLSRVAANITARDPYGATITGYALTVEGKSYPGANPQSGYISGAGSLTVTVSATNSRGFTGWAEYTLPVIAYTPPRITALTAYRCDSFGGRAEDGENLYLSATADFSDVQGQNACALSFRVKRADGDWSDEQSLTNGIVMSGTLYKDSAYTIEVKATDTAGSSSVSRVSIPSEKVYMHRPGGGTGLGLGGYVGEADLLDIYWRVNARQGITAPSVNYRGICSDCNSAVLPGVYRLSGAANAPYSAGLLLVVSGAADPGTDTPAFQLLVSSAGKMAARIKWGSTYQGWKIIAS